jgi:hypothetical protein
MHTLSDLLVVLQAGLVELQNHEGTSMALSHLRHSHN